MRRPLSSFTRLLTQSSLALAILLSLGIAHLNRGGAHQYFYLAGERFLHRENPYTPSISSGDLPFYYPPTALWLAGLSATLPFAASRTAWDLSSVAGFLCIVILVGRWFTGLGGEKPTFSDVGGVAMLSPVAWCLWTHHVTLFTLAAFTLATEFLRRNHSLRSGVLAALSGFKPHLFFIPVLFLFLKASSKKRFLAGLGAVLLLGLAPFVLGYLPRQNLLDGLASVADRQASCFPLDEQNAVGQFIRTGWGLISRPGLLSSPESCFEAPQEIVRLSLRFKAVSGFFVLLLLILYRRRIKEIPLEVGACLALGVGVLTAPYSHCYDGVLLVPLAILAFQRTRHKTRFYSVFSVWFNILVAWFLMYYPGPNGRLVQEWSWMGFYSLAAALAFLARMDFTDILRRSNTVVTLKG